MDAVKLRRAFKASDFDLDGHLNEFEINHFGYLLFGHRKQGDSYQAMCDFCGSNPLFGLNFESILKLFPVNEAYDSKEDCDELDVPPNDHRKRKMKKSKRKKRKKDRKKKKGRKSGTKQRESISNKDAIPRTDGATPGPNANANTLTAPPPSGQQPPVDVMDDLDVAELADLPLSVHDDDDENEMNGDDQNGGGAPGNNTVNAANLRNEKVQSAESNLLHIRHISAFVMSGLRDSSDSEEKEREEMMVNLNGNRNVNGHNMQSADRERDSDHDDDDDRKGDDDNDDEKENIFRLEMEVSEWKDRFQELEQNRTLVTDRYSRLQKSYVSMENDLAVKVKMLELEEMKLTECTLKKKQAERERMEIEEKLKVMRSDRDKLRTQNGALNESISTMQESLDNLNELYAAKSKEIEGLRVKLETAKQIETDCMEQIEALKAVEPERSELAERVETMRQSVNEWKAKHREIVEKMQAVQSEAETMKSTAKRYEEQLAKTVPMEQFKTMTTSMEKEKAERVRYQKEMNGMIQKMESMKERERQKVEALNEKLEATKSKMESIKSKTQKEKQQAVHRMRLEYESTINTLRFENEELNDSLQTLREQQTALHHQQQQLQLQHQQQQRQRLLSDGNSNSSLVKPGLDSNRPSENRPTFNLDFFAVSSVKHEEEEVAEPLIDLSKYTNYREEEDLENVQVNMSEMDLSNRQKVILMKARMAAQRDAVNEEEEEDE